MCAISRERNCLLGLCTALTFYKPHPGVCLLQLSSSNERDLLCPGKFPSAMSLSSLSHENRSLEMIWTFSAVLSY